MKLPPGMRAAAGPFGIVVVMAEHPATPHALLPECFARGALVFSGTIALPIKQVEQLLRTDVTLAPAQLREAKELEALRSSQPFGWGDRTYQSVTGLRWRCCGNAFEDEHTPWCAASGFNDPLPET